ncbi:hypothetical protein LJC69_06195 [Bacteroidales bacterium OttesenSCG-928-K22]|nr:hypothetical protein [Bacteroidales bacterium OttesenSCG-928-K22]
MAILLIACTIVIISNNLILFALKRNNDKTLSPLYLSIVAVVAIVLTIFFNESNNRKEEINAKLIAKDNIFVRNPLVEQTFSWIFNEFGKDSTINNLFINNLIQNESSIYLNNKIYDNFNHGYLSKYYVKYIIADSSTLIRIDNDTTIYNCNEYFNSFINTFGLETEDQNLWYINDLHDVPYYIYNLKTKNYYIWFDIIPKYNLEGIGYSELLSTPESQLYSINLSKYSFAIYINNNLVRNIGKYPYENHFVKEDKIKNGKIFFIEKAYKHFVFTNNEDGTIIISNSYNILTNIISPFSLIFICLIIVHIFSRIFLVFFSGKQFINTPSLKQKIQNSSIIFFVIISLIIGIFSVFLVISLNNNKNKDVLIEKTHSLCKEIELIVNNYEKTSDIDFNEILMNLASIHFLDINIYDDNGFLIGTSNEEMFANNISSTLINIDAFEHLIDNNRYLHNEKIGTYGFLSSYMVFMHNSGEIYILNLPYFTKQVEIKNEITNYIVSFVNLYLIIIIVAIFMTYLLSKFITRPLAMLKEKLSGLSLQKTNEKIDYTQDDEIGKLIEVYNLKVDELEKSANLLAKSERESAWREMAQQVAHEIKNPLTPMKLSTQHLYKIWKENPENFDSQFEKYKETMVSQIDSLSEIATAFSNFAKMPEAKNEKINICNTINFVISFYKQTNTDISLFCESDSIFIIADQNLMMRVFHNLIRNSIQAFKKTNKKDILQISFNITVDNSNVIIKIIDNGPGISPEMKDKIFVPYFTTKSGGAGLGLAIVKNIIENAGGTITNPKTEAGAMFEIILPIC